MWCSFLLPLHTWYAEHKCITRLAIIYKLQLTNCPSIIVNFFCYNGLKFSKQFLTFHGITFNSTSGSMTMWPQRLRCHCASKCLNYLSTKRVSYHSRFNIHQQHSQNLKSRISILHFSGYVSTHVSTTNITLSANPSK